MKRHFINSADCLFLTRLSLRPKYRPRAKGNERNTENLSHVERQSRLEVYLNYLRKLNEKAEGEDEREAKAEVKARSYLLRTTPVKGEDENEDDEIGNGLVQLSRMARMVSTL